MTNRQSQPVRRGRKLVYAAASVAAVLVLSVTGVANAISGGGPAAKNEFPWMVRLLPIGCGGTMITPQIVLTAGHCVGKSGPDTALTATTGAVDLTDPGRTVTQSTDVYKPAGGEWYEADWGLVKLAQPLDVPVLPIATTPKDNTGTFTVIGWGRSVESGPQRQDLQKVEMPFLDDAACQAAIRSPQLNPSEDICAANHDDHASCGGDSGGPLLHRDVDSWVQVGIVSWGGGCEGPFGAEFPGVFTKVSAYAAEIKSAADDLAALP
jgi:secreted trypsin-like serine protease